MGIAGAQFQSRLDVRFPGMRCCIVNPTLDNMVLVQVYEELGQFIISHMPTFQHGQMVRCRLFDSSVAMMPSSAVAATDDV